MTDRRSFLAGLAGVPAVSILAPGDLHRPAPAAEPFDFRWLDDLNGTYKQVFDCGDLAADPLHVVENYLRGFREVMGLEHPTVNAVVAIAARAFPLNASDALWARYGIGERWRVGGPDAAPAPTRNLYAERVADLKARGAVFWQCNNALNGIASMLAGATGRPAPEVRTELVAGLLPGTKIVPAHTMFLNLVQKRGCTYEKL